MTLLGNQPGTQFTHSHLKRGFYFLGLQQQLALTVQMPFCSWSLLSFYSWVPLTFSPNSTHLERDFNHLAIEMLKVWNKVRSRKYCSEIQVQPLSQKLLCLHLREVTLEWENQKISLEMVFPRTFFMLLFSS